MQDVYYYFTVAKVMGKGKFRLSVDPKPLNGF